MIGIETTLYQRLNKIELHGVYINGTFIRIALSDKHTQDCKRIQTSLIHIRL